VIVHWRGGAGPPERVEGPNVTTGELARFGVTVDLAGEQAMLGGRGEIDLLSITVLGAFFDAVRTRGCASVVLDLAEVSSIDVTLGALIADAARRMA